MDNLQLHIKVAILSQQVMSANAKSAGLFNSAMTMQAQMLDMRDTVQGLLKEFPTSSTIEKLVKKFNDEERSRWTDLVDEARIVVGEMKDG